MNKFWILWSIGMVLNLLAYPFIFSGQYTLSFVLNGAAVAFFITALVISKRESI